MASIALGAVGCGSPAPRLSVSSQSIASFQCSHFPVRSLSLSRLACETGVRMGLVVHSIMASWHHVCMYAWHVWTYGTYDMNWRHPLSLDPFIHLTLSFSPEIPRPTPRANLGPDHLCSPRLAALASVNFFAYLPPTQPFKSRAPHPSACTQTSLAAPTTATEDQSTPLPLLF